MKFELTTSSWTYTAEYAEKLKPLGFTFSAIKYEGFAGRFEVHPPKDGITFDTLEEFMEFAEKWGPLVVIDSDTIEIYDSYRE